MPNFSGGEGELSELYLSETDILERYVGNQLWNWGYGINGGLGNNTNTSESSPVQTVSGGTNWKYVSSGGHFVSAIKTDGTLWLWGSNALGGLGDNSVADKSSPVQTISGGTNWKQVSCGELYTAAIKTDGTLWTWGYNASGQLGTNDLVHRSSPVQTIAGGTNWKQVSAGRDLIAAIKTDGTLWQWGSSTGFGAELSPVQTIAGGTNWKQVSCGQNHIAAIKTDGTLWLWGSNSSGQLGDNTITNKSSPVQTVSTGTNWKQVSCGEYFTAAIKTDGTLWLWGSNSSGQLGDNTTTNKSSPVQTVSTGTNWKQVSCNFRTTAAIKTDGTLWLWGWNQYGQLGDWSTLNHRSSPIQTAAGGTNWKQIGDGGWLGITAAVTYTES